MSDAVNVSSFFKKYKTKMKNINKSPSLLSGKDLIIAFEKKNKSFPFLYEKLLREGLLKVNAPFMFTNEVFYNICNEREKLNIKWETIALFITDELNCTQKVLFQSLTPRFVAMENEIQNMSKDWKLKEKKQFLDELFLPPKPKANEVLAESETYFPSPDFESSRNFDLTTLSVDFLSIEKSVENLTEQNSELDACNTELTVQNKSLTRENEKLRHQCEKDTQKVADKVNFCHILRHKTFTKGRGEKKKKFQI